jgi:hypothetical protein
VFFSRSDDVHLLPRFGRCISQSQPPSSSKESVMRKSNINLQVGARPGKVGRVVLWVAKIALASIFMATGASKILGVQQLVDGFALIGIGQWFRYFTGAGLKNSDKLL